MANVAAAFNTAFRAYVTDGVPASGPNKPLKSEVRAIGAAIETELTTGELNVTTELNFGTWSATGATVGMTTSLTQLMHSSQNGSGAQNHWRIYNTNGLVGSVQSNGSATAFNTSSDGRKKKNLKPFDAGPILDAIDVWHGEWKKGGTFYGVVAQDCADVFPDAISHVDDEWAADYSKFVPLLLAEIKALRTRVNALEKGNKK